MCLYCSSSDYLYGLFYFCSETSGEVILRMKRKELYNKSSFLFIIFRRIYSLFSERMVFAMNYTFVALMGLGTLGWALSLVESALDLAKTIKIKKEIERERAL